jgi:hypothetical protein
MAELDIEAAVNLMVVSSCLSARYPEVPRYSEEKGLGDKEACTGQTITRHHHAIVRVQARIEPFDRPDTSWERESESWLSTDKWNL